MTSTIINLTIALILGICALKLRRKPSYVVFILFLYISLHFSYSFMAVVGLLWIPAKPAVSQIGPKIIGIGFLLFTSGLLIFKRAKKILSALRLRPFKRILFFISIWILTVGIVLAVDIYQGKYPPSLTIQNIVSCFIMLTLSFLIATVVTYFSGKEDNCLPTMLNLVLILVIVMDAVSVYQIIASKTFAGYQAKSGAYIRRASGLLFNPNLFGIWCAFVASVTAYAFHKKKYSSASTVVMFVLIAFGILVSGSRSGFIICLFMFGLVPTLRLNYMGWNNVKFSFLPLFLFIFIFYSMGTLFNILNTLAKFRVIFLYQLSALFDRFATMPTEVYVYALFKFTRYMSSACEWLYDITGLTACKGSLDRLVEYSNNLSLGSIGENIDGRLGSDIPMPDNGYLAMYHDAGLWVLLVWLVLWMIIIGAGVKSLRSNPGINSVYALSGIFTCLFSGIFIRSFQVYPVWIMVAIVLGISLAWIHRVIPQKRLP